MAAVEEWVVAGWAVVVMGGGCEGMQDMFPPPEVDQNRATLNMFPMTADRQYCNLLEDPFGRVPAINYFC